jgi:hypothetical protein
MIVRYFHDNDRFAMQRIIDGLIDNHTRRTFSLFDLRLRNHLSIYNVCVGYGDDMSKRLHFKKERKV